MDGYHPKRRKDKDNPYSIYTTENGKHFLSFTDGQGVYHHLEISDDLFQVFDRFELDDLSFLNETDRHYSDEELNDQTIARHLLYKSDSIEEEFYRKMQNEQLHKAIAKLSEKQRKRLILYFFGEITYEEIGKLEGCKYQTVQDSIYAALKRLKKFLE